jgi:hypothetical protein
MAKETKINKEVKSNKEAEVSPQEIKPKVNIQQLDTVVKKLDLDEKVTIRNIAGWNVGFSRLSDMRGDVIVPANGSTRLSRNEIIMQTQNGNRLFLGTDTIGSHATLYIEDRDTRVEVEFDNDDENRKQDILTDAKVTKMFNLKSEKAFINNLEENIVTRAEKYALVQMVKKLNFNEYSKMKIIEGYTGYKFN